MSRFKLLYVPSLYQECRYSPNLVKAAVYVMGRTGVALVKGSRTLTMIFWVFCIQRPSEIRDTSIQIFTGFIIALKRASERRVLGTCTVVHLGIICWQGQRLSLIPNWMRVAAAECIRPRGLLERGHNWSLGYSHSPRHATESAPDR